MLADPPSSNNIPSEDAAATSKLEGILSKETRKLRKRRMLPEFHVFDIDSGDEIDAVDTDDLLEEADRLTPLQTTIWPVSKTRPVKARRAEPTTRNNGENVRKQQCIRTRRIPKQCVPKESPRKRPRVVMAEPSAEDCHELKDIEELSEQYPDSFWKYHADARCGMIDAVNKSRPLEALPYNVTDQGPIMSMTISPDGTLLATFSRVGVIKLWDIANEFRLVWRLRDIEEINIEEFYCGQFTPDQQLVVAAGKLKDRFRWRPADNDNHLLPCPVKIFSLEKGQRVGQLDGHQEEILCIKAIQFKGQNYYVTTSQDGKIRKWQMADDWITLIESTCMRDSITTIAFTVSFLPNTGNKYFLAACDANLCLYDFEEACLLQTFENIYSFYCDCGKFVKWLDAPSEGNDELPHAWFISRGTEKCDMKEGVSRSVLLDINRSNDPRLFQTSIPNTCTLHKLIYPTRRGDKFKLVEVKKFRHEDYHANSWLAKITSNGRYLLAPTTYGQIFVFNMKTGQLTATLKEHEDMEVRDVVFHPHRPFIFSCGDDGCVKVYTFKKKGRKQCVVI